MTEPPPKTIWYRDPAFWIVMISFAVFLATAASVVWNLNIAGSKGRKEKILIDNKAFMGKKNESHAVLDKRATIDARSFRGWIHFSFAKGVVQPMYVSSDNWDLGFKRYHIIANGGAANIAARGGILDLGKADFERVAYPPKRGYVPDIELPGDNDYENMAINHWYLYDYSTHVLTPMSHVYIVRTPKLEYYKMEILGYYCRNLQSGCMTFKYAPITF